VPEQAARESERRFVLSARYRSSASAGSSGDVDAENCGRIAPCTTGGRDRDGHHDGCIAVRQAEALLRSAHLRNAPQFFSGERPLCVGNGWLRWKHCDWDWWQFTLVWGYDRTGATCRTGAWGGDEAIRLPMPVRNWIAFVVTSNKVQDALPMTENLSAAP